MRSAARHAQNKESGIKPQPARLQAGREEWSCHNRPNKGPNVINAQRTGSLLNRPTGQKCSVACLSQKGAIQTQLPGWLEGSLALDLRECQRGLYLPSTVAEAMRQPCAVQITAYSTCKEQRGQTRAGPVSMDGSRAASGAQQRGASEHGRKQSGWWCTALGQCAAVSHNTCPAMLRSRATQR